MQYLLNSEKYFVFKSWILYRGAFFRLQKPAKTRISMHDFSLRKLCFFQYAMKNVPLYKFSSVLSMYVVIWSTYVIDCMYSSCLMYCIPTNCRRDTQVLNTTMMLISGLLGQDKMITVLKFSLSLSYPHPDVLFNPSPSFLLVSFSFFYSYLFYYILAMLSFLFYSCYLIFSYYYFNPIILFLSLLFLPFSHQYIFNLSCSFFKIFYC